MNFRTWLFKLVFGANTDHFSHIAKNHKLIVQVLNEHQDAITSINAILSQIQKQTGGEGWLETIQIAISQLNQRIEYHREVLQVHQDNIAELAKFEVIDVSIENKKDLN